VKDLKIVTSSQMIALLKGSARYSRKTYQVIIHFKNEVNVEDLEKLEEAFNQILVRQRTPLRVLQRRADIVRRKYVYEVKCKKISSHIIRCIIVCQGGLYIKELVTGDNGRTKPSFYEILGNPVEKVLLDVMKVEELVSIDRV